MQGLNSQFCHQGKGIDLCCHYDGVPFGIMCNLMKGNMITDRKSTYEAGIEIGLYEAVDYAHGVFYRIRLTGKGIEHFKKEHEARLEANEQSKYRRHVDVMMQYKIYHEPWLTNEADPIKVEAEVKRWLENKIKNKRGNDNEN
jgi:hypothetical protein